VTLEPDKMNRWHELRVRELDAPVAPVDHACPRDSSCSLESQSLVYFLLILDLMNLRHCASHAGCLVL